MSLFQQNSQVKIKQEIQQHQNHPDNYKQESEPLTEPSDQVKVKLETKVPYEKKQEPNKNTQYALSDRSFASNRSQRPFVVKRRRRNLSQYERVEDVRSVAIHFIEHGLNFRKFSETYPEIDGKFYRNTVEAINNTAINEIEKFLKYENYIMIEKLNRDQKRSIRTQLTKVREWLGKKDIGQLQTLYKFIQRKYQLLNVQISVEEALKFYKTILQIVKSPYVDVMEDDIKPEKFDPEISKQALVEEKQLQEKTLIFLYMQHRNLTKVSDLLCEKFGYTLKWSKHAVKQRIRRMIKVSLKKIIASVEAYDNTLQLYFSQSDECVEKIFMSEEGDNSVTIKMLLLEFYIQKTMTLIELREYVRTLNRFFILRYKDHGEFKCKKFEEDLKIPKLKHQTKGETLEKTVTESSQLKIVYSKSQQSSNYEPIKEEHKQEKLIETHNEHIKEQKYEKKDMLPVLEPIEQQKKPEKKDAQPLKELKKKPIFEQKPKLKFKQEKKEYVLMFEECLTDLEQSQELVKQQQIKLES